MVCLRFDFDGEVGVAAAVTIEVRDGMHAHLVQQEGWGPILLYLGRLASVLEKPEQLLKIVCIANLPGHIDKRRS